MCFVEVGGRILLRNSNWKLKKGNKGKDVEEENLTCANGRLPKNTLTGAYPKEQVKPVIASILQIVPNKKWKERNRREIAKPIIWIIFIFESTKIPVKSIELRLNRAINEKLVINTPIHNNNCLKFVYDF